ncbi:MAG TPA: alpha-amylase family protein [Armatimonadota bacterium]|jgi:hypothetical protein
MTDSRPRLSADHRRLHLDYHNPAGIPDLAADFDPAEFAGTLRRAGFDSATVFAQDAHGHAYFPSAVGVPHPHLQRDLLGEMTAALHAEGLTAAAYVNTGCSDYADPDWAQCGPDGRPRTLDEGGYFLVCLNSPYLERNVLPLSAEILTRYPVEGLWYDLLFFQDEGCHCPWCRERMARLGLDPTSPADVRAHMRGSTDEFAAKVAGLLAEVGSDAEFTLNGLSLHERPQGLTQAAYVDVEALATGGWGYFYIPTKARYLRTLGRPVMGMTAAFHNTWGDFGTLKSRALLEFEVYTMLAAGAGVGIGDQLPPRGRLEPARYDRIGEVLQPLAQLQPYLQDTTPAAEVAILLPPLGQGQFPSEPWIGATRLLMEAKLQFTTVDRLADWSGYPALVLPDDAYADEETRRKLADYLAAGGAILATGAALEALPADLVRRGEPTPGPAYLQVRGDWAPAVPDLPMVMLAGLAPLVAPGAEPLATLTLPYPPREEHFFFSSPQVAYDQPTDQPVLVRQGGLIALGTPLFAEYARTGYGGYRELLLGALRLLLPTPLVQTNLPLAAEVAVLRQGERAVCVLVPYAPVRSDVLPQIEEWPTLADLSLGLRGTYRRAFLPLTGESLTLTWAGDYTVAALPRWTGPVVAVFE